MRSGFIAMVGRPNVGKSTLTNRLCKEKVAIVSDKAGTTRDSIKGIYTKGEYQYVFIDTPGIHKPKHLLGEHMTGIAIRTLREVDCILLILDGTQEISTGDQYVMDRIKEAGNTPRIAVINKSDLFSDEEYEAKKQEIKDKLGEFDDIIMLSSQFGFGVERLLDRVKDFLTDEFWYYPEDMYTDMPVYKIIGEIVREKILERTKEEIPHSVAIEIINVNKREEGQKDKFDVNIYVERDSQKGIIIGKDGKLLKEIGTAARKDIEALLDRTIYLNLWVKVKDKWRKKKPFLKEMGYYIDEE